MLATSSEDEDEMGRGVETELLVRLLRETAVCRNVTLCNITLHYITLHHDIT